MGNKKNEKKKINEKKKKFKNIYYIVYICYALIAIVLSFFIKDTFQIMVLSYSIDVCPPVLSALILIATFISLHAVMVFGENKETIQAEALKVGIDQYYLEKIEKRFKFIGSPMIKAIMILSSLSAILIVGAADNGYWRSYTHYYALALVGILIAITLYAYIYFLIIILCIKCVYDSDFQRYTFVYPLATDIFEKFNQIFTVGLVCFWIIGFVLIGLSFIVFDVTALAVLLIIGGLIGIGYIVFTFYPYYITRRKVSLLKLQTIRGLCKNHNLLCKNGYDQFNEIIKFIWESPTVLTTNFNLVLTSTVAAIASLLTPLISIWR